MNLYPKYIFRSITLAFTLLIASAGFTVTARAADTDLDAVLDRPVPRYSSETEQPLRQILDGIGLSYNIPIVMQDGVGGGVMLNVSNTDLRGLLTMLCRPGGYFWAVEDGYVYVRRTKTVLYAVEYPQNSRSSQDTASVTLGGSGSSGSGSGGTTGYGGTSPVQSIGANGSGNGSSGGNDSTQVSVTGENRVEFWDKMEAQIKAMLGKDESVIVNKFAGLIEVDANLGSHARVSSFLTRLNRRIGRQISLQAKVLEVVLNDQSKLGIDWNVAAFSIGGGNSRNTPQVGIPLVQPGTGTGFSGLVGSTLNAVQTVADQNLAAATFSGTIGIGKVSALVQALSQQGNVRSVSAPRISALNNQTAFIKIAQEKTFWQQSNTTQIYSSNGGVGGTQPVVVGNYTPRNISIGNFLKVVAQVTDDARPEEAVITLDVSPVLTKLTGQDISPDGKSNSPILDVQQASTMVRVKNGESAVLGGFQTWTEGSQTNAIPGLGSLPFIGRAFRTDGKVARLTELVIVITATVIDPGTSKPLDIDEVLHKGNNTITRTPTVLNNSPAVRGNGVNAPAVSAAKPAAQIIDVP